MRIPKALLAGAGLLAAGAAVAAEPASKVMKVALPDGSVAQIRYTGDVPPKIVVLPSRPARVATDVSARFSMVDRMFADMDRRMDAMLRQAAAMSRQAASGNGQVTRIATGQLPPGTISYSFVSTSNGATTCARSVRVTRANAKEEPKVISETFGNCGDGKGGKPQAAPAAPAAAPDPRETI